VQFHEINLAFLNRFEVQHLKKGKSYNGLAAYLRAVRAIYNQAIKAGLVDREMYPFTNYEIKTTKTRKRAISRDAIKKIENCILEPDDPLFNARNYFLASFYLRGISFTDLAELKVSDIVSGRIHYQRKKTDKPYDMPVSESLQKILDIYLPGKNKDSYIFPITTRETLEERYVQIQDARKRFNKKLKLLATKCEIDEALTSYVSRHSFATIAKNLGFAVAAISDMLGHESISTTQIYLDTLPSNMLDEMHNKIIE
jgi:site-specific recombinase XerD